MARDLSLLDAFIADIGVDGYLIEADGSESDQRYLAGFGAPDSFTTLHTGGETHLLVSGLEYGRAQSESRADTVSQTAKYGHMANVAEHGRRLGKVATLASFLDDHGVESVAVPFEFPTGIAEGLRERGIEVAVDAVEVVSEVRAIKTDEEVEHIREAQRANERAMAAAEELLSAATVEDGTLYLDGEVLTSERVTEEIEVTLIGEGCALDETIVACGAQAADPHDRGSGPLLAGETIVIDIFPRNKESKYHADMTRTFVKGEPSETAREWYELTFEALEAALDVIGPGVTGAEVHEAVCDVYEDAGCPTLRSDESTETGFIHSTGHGIGLDVHEKPSLSLSVTEELQPGHVVTVEPGLYDPDVGGIRIEDFVVITEDGYENVVDYPKEFVLD